jgi:hypothetical protein
MYLTARISLRQVVEKSAKKKLALHFVKHTLIPENTYINED